MMTIPSEKVDFIRTGNMTCTTRVQQANQSLVVDGRAGLAGGQPAQALGAAAPGEATRTSVGSLWPTDCREELP